MAMAPFVPAETPWRLERQKETQGTHGQIKENTYVEKY